MRSHTVRYISTNDWVMADDLVTTNDWMVTGDLMARDDWFMRDHWIATGGSVRVGDDGDW
jgi:hypothetical protein